MKTLLLIALTNLYVMHPFHVSVCDVVYKSDDKHLKISVRVFLDDLEVGLRNYSGDQALIIDKIDTDIRNKLLKAYFENTLAFSTRGKKLDLVYLGSEIEQDVVWSYLEVEKLKPFNDMEVTNTMLLQTFPDQENLVHIRKDGVVRSMRIMRDRESRSVSWD